MKISFGAFLFHFFFQFLLYPEYTIDVSLYEISLEALQVCAGDSSSLFIDMLSDCHLTGLIQMLLYLAYLLYLPVKKANIPRRHERPDPPGTHHPLKSNFMV